MVINFSSTQGLIAPFLGEIFGQGNSIRDNRTPGSPIVIHPRGGGPQAAHDGGSRRVATGGCTVSSVKECTAGSEPLQVWRLDRVVLIKQGRPVVHVINGDKQNIRFTGLGCRRN